jgi:CRP/FNR family transcriptional regulator, cyclic AMP receptor protein
LSVSRQFTLSLSSRAKVALNAVHNAPSKNLYASTVLNESETLLVSQLMRGADALDGMPDAVARRIASMMSMMDFPAGANLTQESKTTHGLLMLVVSGRVEVSSAHREESGHLVLRVAKPGNIIGEVGFIDGQAHSATCTASEPTCVAALERDDFVHLFETETACAAQLMAGLMRLMAGRIRHANRFMLAQDQHILQLQTDLLTRDKAVPLRGTTAHQGLEPAL